MERDFTFPTVAAPAPAPAGKWRDIGQVQFLGHLSPGTTSPIWPFSSASSPKITPPVRATAVDEEEAPPPRRTGQHTEATVDEDRMDQLWEDFNVNDVMERRAGSANGGGCGFRCPRSSTPSLSDAESEETSTPSARERRGCTPTMLRASSRAGRVGQFFTSSARCHRGRKTTGWALLMRLFRRLLAVDKTTPPPSRSRPHGIHAS